MVRAVSALAVLALVASPALAQEAPLTPTGPWQASSNGVLCRLERPFDGGGEAHLLILEQNGPGPRFGLAMAGPSLTSLSSSGPIRLGFAEGDPGFERPARIEPNQQFGRVAVVTGLVFENPERKSFARINVDVMEHLDRITMAQGDTRVTFETGSLGEAARLLNTCSSQVLRSWGLDPEEQYSLQQAVSAEKVRFDYPRSAQNYLRSGPVDAVVLIDPAGAATECKILATSGYDDLDQAVCKALTKPRYRPAIGASGDPVASYWQTRVNFQIRPSAR